METENKKSEKELLDEELKNWPYELGQEAINISTKYNLLTENFKFDLNNEEDILNYCSDCIPWDDFVKEWIK